ncbi:DUF4271 domain-containing protein [Flammeovirga sp. SJP92]|uniref:DUF4271 domain-containing protein n=1 Tax=Flammeovirga sp. SJP92 TaxID=1775430 RepID=UPI0007896B16|nr:DUF4271 domain-containing protein [Flammeovirga sp. SJP92]KXX68674.1 hypothetical protein AVL50_23235 [Flammeovirga sp. SJP92]
MRYFYHIIFSFITFFALQSKVLAIEFPIQDKWLIYESKVNGFVPYIPEEHSFVKNFYLLLDVKNLNGLGVEFIIPQNAAVFVNNQLQDISKKENGLVYFSNEELKAQQKVTGELLFVVNTVDGNAPQSFFVDKRIPLSQLMSSSLIKSGVHKEKKRFHSDFREMLLMWSLIVFAFVGLSAKVGGLKTGANSLMRSFEGVTMGRADSTKMNTLQLIMFIFSFTLVGSLALMLFGNGEIWLSQVNSAELNKDVSAFAFNILYVMIAILAFVAFRLIIIYFLGNIFSNTNIPSIHGAEFYKLTWVYVLFYMIICVFWTLNPFYISWEFMRLFLGIGFLAKSFLVYIAVSKQVNFRNNYLFSYFCATEFLPSLLAVKVFIS